jgi:peptide-methionine (S)-S-oxide reductase
MDRAQSMSKIGFGGGCHWCTEAVFQTLRGVACVTQGFIQSTPPHDTFSEAVIVDYDPDTIPLDILIAIHLRTHASTSPHKMRGKYRSAVYTFSDAQTAEVKSLIKAEHPNFEAPLVTLTLTHIAFKASDTRFQNYYATDAERPFCTTYIDPKLAKIRREYGNYASSIT